MTRLLCNELFSCIDLPYSQDRDKKQEEAGVVGHLKHSVKVFPVWNLFLEPWSVWRVFCSSLYSLFFTQDKLSSASYI